MKFSRAGMRKKMQVTTKSSNKRAKTPAKGTSEYKEYLSKLRLLEQIRLKKLQALEELCKILN